MTEADQNSGLVVAFDATGAGLCAVVGSAAGVAASRVTPGPRGQVEELIPALEACLAEARAEWREVTRIATAVGPGSFVGVRVGVAAARGFGAALGVPLVELDGFTIAAESARRSGARGERVAALFGSGDRLIWKIFQLTDDGAAARGDATKGDRAAFDAVALDLVVGPAAEALFGSSPGMARSNPEALLALALSGAPADEPIRPFYARPPDATPPSRQPPPRI
ncbi:MAG: tRNA (adenosine(37)-N6)-threonylcarbamoyltransferase complex dimerization subunit type 1 TsaB [Neomegalonema sp.]|nr:tRNA (adenosine(37)-N6)-threonylcarbamoyltransferase complex dimerization subunit type 1 TsaB [Neomegalonema sp.]